jgi:iron complex outermembrane receptor protein
MKKLFTTCFFLLSTLMIVFGQNMVKGIVVDAESHDPLIGVSVLIEGTTTGTVSDFNGEFELSVPSKGETTLVFSYVGFDVLEKMVNVDGSVDLGEVLMRSTAVGLGEVVVLGVVDIAEDRKTPVAVSTIKFAEIQAKSGNTEFPDVMKNTPSIYVTNQNGGFGDSKVFTRGFDQTNTAFLLNGQPINGMEDGRMYWSNWSGMTDIANAVQVQRGLGSSKLAISSVGGTVNIVTKATEQQQGGWAQLTYGNDNFIKATAAYSTGLMNDKFGVTALFTHWQGDGWAEGTKGQGQNYFVSVGYRPAKNHNINFLITGAPQWHDQNFRKRISQHEIDGEIDRRYNNNWGTLNGEYLSERRNYYHKPVANLNWSWNINDKSSLSTVLYASWGRGGGTGNVGSRVRTDEGYVDWDAIQANNLASADGSATYAIRASANNHQWYGIVSSFETNLTENITWSIGTDLRRYTGLHFRQIMNLLGADYFLDTRHLRYPNNQITATYEANPWQAISNFAEEDERYAWDYSETIQYGGLFTQLEYVKDRVSAYVQGSVSLQSHVRFDRYQYTEADEESETIVNPGFNVKGGLNYNINESSSVYANAGYYSRQPFHDNLYLNFRNELNEVASNEDVIGMEIGYKLRTQKLDLNLNLYRTAWNNRVETRSILDGDTLTLIDGTLYPFPNGGFSNQANINQLHQGVELDARFRATRGLTIKAFASFGNWVYNGNATQDIYDDERKLIQSSDALFIDGAKVGGSAQTSMGAGLDYRITRDLSFYTDFNYYDNLFAEIGPQDGTFTDENNDGVIELPSFGVLDAGASYKFNFGDNVLRLRVNVYNLLDATYIAESSSNVQPSADDNENWNGVNKSNFVQWGRGRTWNVSVRYQF